MELLLRVETWLAHDTEHIHRTVKPNQQCIVVRSGTTLEIVEDKSDFDLPSFQALDW